MTEKEACTIIKNHGLTVLTIGTGEAVTAQIPAAGQKIPGNGQVILYLGENPEGQMVTVPDFSGMNRQQASLAAGELGLSILVSGNPEIAPRVVVTAQSEEKGTQVQAGTTIILTFTDTTARD